MKIKFIKEFKYPGFDISSGAIKDSENYGFQNEVKGWFQWLIDNGFAEEVKESGWWKPKYGKRYYYLGEYGRIKVGTWNDCLWDKNLYAMGDIFKTDGATERYCDYLKAIATVRQDEGVLTPEQIYELGMNNGEAYHIACTDKQNGADELSVCEMDLYFWPPVGVILFDTDEHADDSLDKHPDEWKIIANYDWSRE